MGFGIGTIDLDLAPQKRDLVVTSVPVQATSVGIVSSVGNGAEMEEGEVIVHVAVEGTHGERIGKDLLVGRDTAEWAWDQEDVRKIVRHQRARVADSFLVFDGQGRSFPGHHYVTKIDLGTSVTVEKVTLRYAAVRGQIHIKDISLHDDGPGTSRPLGLVASHLALKDRWQQLARLEGVDVYENLQVLPRAWLVPRTVFLSSEDVLHTIKEGKLPDGTPYKPREVALVEHWEELRVETFDPQAQVEVVAHRPNRIELITHSSSPAFLVLSEIFYPGWKAFVDGTEVTIKRTNYVLRGLHLPAGSHLVRFEYNPLSFRLGMAISLLALVGLIGLLGAAYQQGAQQGLLRRRIR